MNHTFKTMILILLTAGFIFTLYCSKINYEKMISGTWEWTGDSCDEEGNCKKEIITDPGSYETYSDDGLYNSGMSRRSYKIENKKILFASDAKKFDITHAEIIRIDTKTMLLKFKGSIKRYARAASP